MVRFDIENFELVKFYSYTSVIPTTVSILEVDDDDKHNPRMVKQLQLFYGNLRTKAGELSGENKMSFVDNKTVFKLRHKETGNSLYIGHKDGRYTVGLGVYVWFGNIYDFETKTWSEYVTQLAD